MSRNWYSQLEQNHYSKWHRQYDGVAYIDIDAIEVCKRCTEPLAFIEHAQDTGQKFKTYTLTKKLADKFNTPGFVLLYTLDNKKEIVKFRVKRISPEVRMVKNNILPQEWLDYLLQLQSDHKELCNAKEIESVEYDFDKWEGTD